METVILDEQSYYDIVDVFGETVQSLGLTLSSGHNTNEQSPDKPSKAESQVPQRWWGVIIRIDRYFTFPDSLLASYTLVVALQTAVCPLRTHKGSGLLCGGPNRRQAFLRSSQVEGFNKKPRGGRDSGGFSSRLINLGDAQYAAPALTMSSVTLWVITGATLR
ncbi:unnamed protein product [Lota lota]